MKIDLLLADDHAVLREGLQILLEAQGDLRVMDSVSNGREAVQKAKELRPQVVLMDIAMPELNGIEATRQIRAAMPQTQVVILSIYSSAEHVYNALQAGARGYLLKESAGREVVEAVRVVAQGGRYLSRKLTEVLPAGLVIDKPGRSPLESLSEREREVLQLTVEGRSAAQAAELLALSPKTVETYRSRLMQKLGVNDLPSLVKFAIQHGLTSLE
jgi:DNA-binding NarL/FixJ family response regulator